MPDKVGSSANTLAAAERLVVAQLRLAQSKRACAEYEKLIKELKELKR